MTFTVIVRWEEHPLMGLVRGYVCCMTESFIVFTSRIKVLRFPATCSQSTHSNLYISLHSIWEFLCFFLVLPQDQHTHTELFPHVWIPAPLTTRTSPKHEVWVGYGHIHVWTEHRIWIQWKKTFLPRDRNPSFRWLFNWLCGDNKPKIQTSSTTERFVNK